MSVDSLGDSMDGLDSELSISSDVLPGEVQGSVELELMLNSLT